MKSFFLEIPGSFVERSLRTLAAGGLGFLFLLSFASCLNADEPREFVLEADDTRQWYRGNLHTHSHWSDGDDYLENIALWYREHDYDFLCFTDHNVLAQGERWEVIDKTKGGRVAFDKLEKNFPELTETRMKEGEQQVRLRTFREISKQFNQPGEFLLIQGEEVSDRFDRYPIHLNVSNLKELITPRRGESVADTIQNNVNAAITQRERTGQSMMIHLNHPNFGYAVTVEDLMRVVGERFFEVYNGHPSVHNRGDEQHASTERMWDIILTRRVAEFDLPMMYGLAVDDGHNYHHIPSRRSEPGRGWVVVLADELQPGQLVEELEKGNFYASSGVDLKRIAVGNGKLEIEIDPVQGETYTTEFVGTKRGYDPTSQPVLDDEGKPLHATRRYSKEIGEVFQKSEGTSVSYQFEGDEIYVRARITSSALHPNPSELKDPKMAWTQPVIVAGKKKSEN